jgi:acyl transferase domain-containing protein/acyl carrier protein
MSDFLDRIASLSPKRLALLALELHTELETMRKADAEPIAIVGIGCRFPGGAHGPAAFWEVLRTGVDTVSEVPRDRWDIHQYYDPDPDAPGKMYSRYGAFLEHVDRFDAVFFGIAPREAAQMDPQQRLVLEVAWEALEHAGQSPHGLARTAAGVFLGVCTYDHSLTHLTDPLRIETYASSGSAPSILSNRLSYLLDLQGPSLTIDTACSSSLVAVHLACQSLRRGECNLALAGGVNLMLSPITTIALCKGRMLAADGRCKTFDASADGYVRGEGCGIVVLKRLSDALANHDCVCGVIRGSAVNQDGYGNGLTAPNLLAQQAVIRQALQQAQVHPDQVGYIEAHGTGTALGDPIEVEALRDTYGRERPSSNPCALGSVKTNIGHLEGAAGIAGLIKAVLALQHDAIPPHLHFRQLNPHISLEDTPFFIPTRIGDWPAGAGPRCAAVSSFGFGGTNAHVVVADAPVPAAVPETGVDRPLHVLTLSAKSETALSELARRHCALPDRPAPRWADVCFTANAGRAHFPERLAVVADSASESREQLAGFLAGETVPNVRYGGATEARTPKVAFLFTGQGAQYIGMGRQLYETQPTFRTALDRCDELLRPHLERPLISVLYPDAGRGSPLNETAYAQPALLALELALVELWRSFGVTPGAVLGHSVGEYAAACAAGVFGVDDGLRLVAARGRLMQALPTGGAMAVVFAGEADVAEAIGNDSELSIAAINGPAETVLSGRRARLETVLQDLQAEGVQSRPLTVSHAFHSPLMEPMLDRLEAVVATVVRSEPLLGFISNLTGRPIEQGVVTQSRYWRHHARHPVRFAAGIRALYAQGYRVFVEIGPHPVLSTLGTSCVPEDGSVWLPSLRRGTEDWRQLLNSLAVLYTRGGTVDWRGFDADYSRRRVVLPTYPFERQQFRVDSTRAAPSRKDCLYELQWQPQALAEAADRLAAESGGRWMILTDCAGVGASLAAALEARGDECTLVCSGTTYARRGERHWDVNADVAADFHRLMVDVRAPSPVPLRGVVHLWSLDTTAADPGDGAAIQDDVLRSCGSVLHLLQALLSVPMDPGPRLQPRLWLVTRGAHQPASSSAVAQTPLWGLARVVALEHPELRCTCVDLDADAGTSSPARLLREITADGREDQIAWRSEVRFVARLLPARLIPRSEDGLVRSDKSYVITGGAGALGLEVARSFVARGARHLVLIGRHAPPREVLDAIAEWQQAGAHVTVVQADVAQKADVARALDVVRDTPYPLGGVVHAAGVLDDGFLMQQSRTRFAAVLSSKIAGAWNLHVLTRELPLDFLVFFSSMTSLLGTPGQGSYAAANAFLDGLAHYRRSSGLPAISIDWGPWAGRGMAASREDQQRQHGVDPLPPDEGAALLGRLLGHDAPRIGVFAVGWRRFLERFDGEVPPVLADLERQAGFPRRNRREPGELRRRLERVPASRRHELVAAHVRGQAIQVIGLDRTHPLEPRTPLRELGVDSLLSVELARALSVDIGRPLPPTMVFTHPTVAEIAAYLLAELFPPVPHGSCPEPSVEEWNA